MTAEQGLQERGFSGSIRTDESEYLVALQNTREAIDERAVAHLHRGLVRHHHAVAPSILHLEPKSHRVFLAHRSAHPRESRQELAPPFCLFAILPGEVARDVILLARDGPLLLVEGTLLGEASFGALSDERAVTPDIRRGCLSFEVQHVIGDILQERTIMADEKNRLRAPAQMLLEPPCGFEI